MVTEPEELSLTAGQKTRLLGLALGRDQPAGAADEDEQRGDLLCDILRRPLPVDRASHRAVPLGTGAPCLGLRTVLGPPLGEVLQNPASDVAVLRQIKDHAKRLGEQAASKAEKDVLLAVYFAAIASALAIHNERITRHSSQDLDQFFALYGRAGWIPADLRGLCLKARQRLPLDEGEG